jgi:hypothetical protein
VGAVVFKEAESALAIFEGDKLLAQQSDLYRVAIRPR